jgi:hypothetical protein
MDQISIPSILFVSFPEELVIAILGVIFIGKFSYFKQKSNYIRIFLFTALFASSMFFLRRAVSDVVENLLISVLISCILFIFVMRLKFYESILATLFSFITSIILQVASIATILAITGNSLDYMLKSDVNRFLVSLPERIIEVVLIVIAYKYRIKFIDLECTPIKRKEYYIQLFVYIFSIGTLISVSILIGKILFFDNGNIVSQSDELLLRLNIYLSLFVTIVLTLALKNMNEFYKNKRTLNDNEILQNLEYISGLIKEEKHLDAQDELESLKSHISKMS